ncbi:MAG TPA: signal peptidase I [Candidatus Paceibacterota bacterium]
MDAISQRQDQLQAENSKPKQEKGDFISFLLWAVIIVVPIRLWVAQPFIVSGESMVPTFQSADYLIVDELTYHFRNPSQGEVIIFKYPKDPSKYFIKRVIGTPGDTIDGKVLPFGQYFVEGDNRGASSDSRIWGTVPRDNIIGRPIVRLLPISEIDFLPGTDPETVQAFVK